MIKKDSLGRVDRYSAAVLHTDTEHYITPRDIEWMHFARRHGGKITTSQFHALTSTHLKSTQTTSRRLNFLTHYFGYFYCPLQQKTPVSRNRDLIYCLTPKGVKFLNSLDGCPNYEFAPAIKITEFEFEHGVMSSSISASMELNALETEYSITHQHEMGVDLKMQAVGDLTPDGVSILSKSDNQIFLPREEDRGTEPLSSSNPHRKSIEKNLKQWKTAIEDGIYKDHFHVKCGAFLLFTTVNESRMNTIMNDLMPQIFGKRCNYILFRTIPEFGNPFRAPKVLNILNSPWKMYGNPDFQFIK